MLDLFRDPKTGEKVLSLICDNCALRSPVKGHEEGWKEFKPDFNDYPVIVNICPTCMKKVYALAQKGIVEVKEHVNI